MVNLISSLTERGAVSSMEVEYSVFIHRLRRWPSLLVEQWETVIR